MIRFQQFLKENEHVKKYASFGDHNNEINSGLRNNNLKPEHHEAVAAIDSHIDNNRVQTYKTYFRGMDKPPPKEFRTKDFTSMSTDEDTAMHYGKHVLQVGAIGGTKIADISKHSQFPSEEEHLLARNSKIVVTHSKGNRHFGYIEKE